MINLTNRSIFRMFRPTFVQAFLVAIPRELKKMLRSLTKSFRVFHLGQKSNAINNFHWTDVFLGSLHNTLMYSGINKSMFYVKWLFRVQKVSSKP